MNDATERYREARRWLDDRPNFELGSPAEQAAARFPLERPAALVAELGRPDRSFRIVLVAGTKGKGSTATLIASILQAHGLRVGLYSQPHLHSLRERLRIDGELISEAEFGRQVEQISPQVEALDSARTELGRLTTYEIITALGLRWFAQRPVDWAVLEVGLGGRLDATNIVSPTVAVITPISYDHMHILGTTLAQIAAEKAGIVKPGGLVVSAPQRPAALAVIRRACRAQGAHLTVVGRPNGPRILRRSASTLAADADDPAPRPFFELDVAGTLHRYEGLKLYLGGEHQVVNLLTALTSLEVAAGPGLTLNPDAVRAGVAAARWPGRLEVVRTAPLVVLDGAHNGASAERLIEALRLHFRFDRLHLVLGVFADKDLGAILRPLRQADSLTAVHVEGARARPAEAVANAARRLGINATVGGEVGPALESVIRQAAPRDLICVTGSLAVVAAAREALGLAVGESGAGT